MKARPPLTLETARLEAAEVARRAREAGYHRGGKPLSFVICDRDGEIFWCLAGTHLALPGAVVLEEVK